jgi:hypothetical protein
MIPLIVAFVMLACVGLAGILILRRVSPSTTVNACDKAWLDEFSVASYGPMLRLLAEDDFDYLKSQLGFNSRALRKVRANRRAIFRSYLKGLIGDFNRLHLFARMVLLYARRDRPELASALVKQRLTFACAIAQVEFKLALHAVGVGTVDVRNLLDIIDTLRINVDEFAAAPAAA